MSSRSISPMKLALVLVLLFACVMAARLLWAAAAQPTTPGTSPSFGIGAAQAAQSDKDLFDCDGFEDQADAQAQLIEGDPYGLDEDGDGVACNEQDVELAAQRTEQDDSQSSGGEDDSDRTSSQQSSEQYQYGGGSNYQYDNDSSASRTESGQYDTQLLEAGGPSTGPVPQLPSGECPPEFPVEDRGGCIPATD